MSRPRLLDLFCGAGGASVGYHRAGFDVTGVDVRPQPDYPFEFVQADAMRFVDGIRYAHFDAVHASPPCQLFTRASHLRDAQGAKSKETVDLLTPTLAAFAGLDRPWVVENVPGSPMDGLTLCGSMFGLRVRRHRVFASNLLLTAPGPCRHREQGRPVGVYHVMGDEVPKGGKTAESLEEGQAAMGIDWMPWGSLKEAIPPAYTEHLGRQLLGAL